MSKQKYRTLNNKFFGLLVVVLFFNFSTYSQTGGNFELSLYTTVFPNGTPNQAVNIQFPSVPLWGWFEVTITSAYNNQLATGKLTKRYQIGHNVGGYFDQATEIPTAFGPVASQWLIGDFNHDTNSIPIYHLVSTSNILMIKIEGVMVISAANLDLIKTGTTISALETATAPKTRHYMSIMQDRVGIGTNSPDSALAVNGIIHSKEVKVDLNNWPDFVFKKNYDLPPLEEVEKHINDNGHLENIPSEEEVLKNGINLGEMNARLLQKIEELTLYVIDLNKKVNELQDSNAKIVGENKVLVQKAKVLEEK
ncbi:hypothetical protein J0383_17125 [Flavobacterium endoglycinae]|uniref:Uncharacterized protein n=1 Tax=Flavobacterium endoglycinae TaxID=2816357 RepID=A0ABX7QB83_9FLAO|nr:hypothetical protein [Flavobacterium endoglycinae]QSW87985.1 hypothetical protein J0383_17125 [Flavobacterium endoglycinae]